MNETVSDLAVEWRGTVAVLSSRTPVARQSLRATLKQFVETDDRCRAIVLAWPDDGRFLHEDRTGEASGGLALEIFRLLAAGRRPTIAAVGKHADGTSMSLAAACDYVVATSETRFSCDFGDRPPEGGVLWSLARRVGAGRARERLLTAGSFDAHEAFARGLANSVVQPGGALEAAIEVAARYAGMPPVAMAWLKRVMTAGTDTLDQAIETETNVQPFLRFTEDHREAVKAFLEKRQPNFVGR